MNFTEQQRQAIVFALAVIDRTAGGYSPAEKDLHRETLIQMACIPPGPPEPPIPPQ